MNEKPVHGEPEEITDAEVVPAEAMPAPAAPAEPPKGKEVAERPAGTVGLPFSAKEVGLQCNTCFLGKMCVEFKPDKPCSLGITANIEGPSDVVAFTKYMLKVSAERVMRAYHFELTNGGVISPEVKEAMSQFMDITRMVKELTSEGETIKIEAKGKGIISQIFGSMGRVNDQK